MRRLVQHAAVGVGCTVLAVGVAVTGLGSPAADSAAVAVPVPALGQLVPGESAVDAERVARQQQADRSAAREQLTAQAIARASQRTVALTSQGRAIDEQRAKIAAAARARTAQRKADARAKAEAAAEAARAAAARRAAQKAAAAAAEKARLARVKAQGYEAGTTDPREIAQQILQNKFGYGADQFSCFNNIIIRESNWDVDATNASSGAYGIPQALPGSKMASVAGDWRTNPATQIIWAVGYMDDRYGSPCQAWSFKSANGWY